MSNETCQRCGETEEDRRILWMACFYKMEELGIPFRQKALFRARLEDLTRASDGVSVPIGNSESICIQSGTVRSSGELESMGLYTLRVCKRCRADWMAAIKQWFYSAPTGEGDGDIPIRELGALRMIDDEQWERRHPSERPIRIGKEKE